MRGELLVKFQRHCECNAKFMAENRASFASKIQMYVRETFLAGKTHVVTYSRKFRVKEKKKGVTICKAPKHHVDGTNSEVVFVCERAIGILAVLSRFSYF